MPDCSYDIQYADERVEDRGRATSREILEAFDAFDWSSQVAEANRIQKCSPTFSVRDAESNRLLWVSACETPAGMRFVSSYTYEGEKSLFGLFERTAQISPKTRELTLDEARRAQELFVAGDHPGCHSSQPLSKALQLTRPRAPFGRPPVAGRRWVYPGVAQRRFERGPSHRGRAAERPIH